MEPLLWEAQVSKVMIAENNEKPTHEETLPFFYIGKYEVTQKLWKAVMGTDFDQSYNSGCEDCPAEYISWNDTQKFISKLNTLTNKTFRLPTDIEWEYGRTRWQV